MTSLFSLVLLQTSSHSYGLIGVQESSTGLKVTQFKLRTLGKDKVKAEKFKETSLASPTSLTQRNEQLSISPDGNQLALLVKDSLGAKLKIFSTKSLKEVFSFPLSSGMDGITWSHSEKFLLASKYENGKWQMEGISVPQRKSTKFQGNFDVVVWERSGGIVFTHEVSATKWTSLDLVSGSKRDLTTEFVAKTSGLSSDKRKFGQLASLFTPDPHVWGSKGVVFPFTSYKAFAESSSIDTVLWDGKIFDVKRPHSGGGSYTSVSWLSADQLAYVSNDLVFLKQSAPKNMLELGIFGVSSQKRSSMVVSVGREFPNRYAVCNVQ